MSKIGSNIRKIRTVKGLNQSQFAELFNLNRARIGAYEEGRAEPKIDVVIEIAKYFSIPLNDIFVKDLTVNQLTHFDLVPNTSTKGKGITDNSIQQLHFLSSAQLLNQNLLHQAMENLEDLYRFSFPGSANNGNMWIELSGVKIKTGNQLAPFGAIVSTEEVPKSNALIIAITDEQIYLGNYISGKTNLKLTLGTTEIELSKVKYHFPVKLVIQKTLGDVVSIDSQLKQLEERVSKLEKTK